MSSTRTPTDFWVGLRDSPSVSQLLALYTPRALTQYSCLQTFNSNAIKDAPSGKEPDEHITFYARIWELMGFMERLSPYKSYSPHTASSKMLIFKNFEIPPKPVNGFSFLIPRPPTDVSKESQGNGGDSSSSSSDSDDDMPLGVPRPIPMVTSGEDTDTVHVHYGAPIAPRTTTLLLQPVTENLPTVVKHENDNFVFPAPEVIVISGGESTTDSQQLGGGCSCHIGTKRKSPPTTEPIPRKKGKTAKGAVPREPVEPSRETAGSQTRGREVLLPPRLLLRASPRARSPSTLVTSPLQQAEEWQVHNNKKDNPSFLTKQECIALMKAILPHEHLPADPAYLEEYRIHWNLIFQLLSARAPTDPETYLPQEGPHQWKASLAFAAWTATMFFERFESEEDREKLLRVTFIQGLSTRSLYEGPFVPFVHRLDEPIPGHDSTYSYYTATEKLPTTSLLPANYPEFVQVPFLEGYQNPVATDLQELGDRDDADNKGNK
ncbi:hypothetical protein B0H10DRAFT_1939860 [Mycena sp. CBHHK59/15]|nr:hypothetical protein B0H10DRAFT_1939860 [Mycena sp. CBHHK59/15]